MGSPTCRSGTARPSPTRVGQVVEVDRDEAEVLEPAEDGQQQRRPTPPWRCAGTARCAWPCTQAPAGEGNHRRREQEQAVAPAHPAVEHVAQADHGQLPPARIRVEEPIHREGDGEEDCEVDCGKEHRERSADCAECTAARPLRACTHQARRARRGPGATPRLPDALAAALPAPRSGGRQPGAPGPGVGRLSPWP